MNVPRISAVRFYGAAIGLSGRQRVALLRVATMPDGPDGLFLPILCPNLICTRVKNLKPEPKPNITLEKRPKQWGGGEIMN